MNYKEIRTKDDGTIHKTFNDACYEREIQDDDKEYINAINEARLLAISNNLRRPLPCYLL